MNDNPSDLALPNPLEEDDNTLEKLQKKNERLQSILIKAKGTITQYKSKIDELEKELYQTLLKANELQGLNSKLLKYEPPRADSITETLCRVKFQDEIYCFAKASKGNYWLPEAYYKGKGTLPELIDTSCTKKNLTEQISQINQDWQEKISKIRDQLAAQELKNVPLQEIIKDQQSKIESLEKEAKKFKEAGVHSLISMSSDIYDTILNMILDDTLDNAKISAIQKSLNAFSNNYIENDAGKVKDHCSVLLKSLLDISKRLLYARNELKTQDQAWRATCDALLHEKEELKHQVSRLKAELNTR